MTADTEQLPKPQLGHDGACWYVWCPCGYLVTGWPTQPVAQSDLLNHAAQHHTVEIDSKASVPG